MKETGIILSVIGAVACAIILGVAMGANCGCDNTQKQQHTVRQSHEKHHKKHNDEKENVYLDDTQSHGPHLSVLPIGPKLFGPFHLGF